MYVTTLSGTHTSKAMHAYEHAEFIASKETGLVLEEKFKVEPFTPDFEQEGVHVAVYRPVRNDYIYKGSAFLRRVSLEFEDSWEVQVSAYSDTEGLSENILRLKWSKDLVLLSGLNKETFVPNVLHTDLSKDSDFDLYVGWADIIKTDRNEYPVLLYKYFDYLYPEDRAIALCSAWNICDMPLQVLSASTWVDLFHEAEFSVDGIPTDVEDYYGKKVITVYRGCTEDQRFGMSWSLDVDVAQRFADMREGYVYQLTIPVTYILAEIHERSEREVVVNIEDLRECFPSIEPQQI